MLSCKEITEQASNYLESDLPLFKRLQFKTHLFMCVHCRRYVKQLSLTIHALGLMKKEDSVDDEIVKNVLKNLKEHGHIDCCPGEPSKD